jgi:hypothetical protein
VHVHARAHACAPMPPMPVHYASRTIACGVAPPFRSISVASRMGSKSAVLSDCSCQRYLGMLLTCTELEDGSLVMRQHWPSYNCDAIRGRTALATVGIIVFIFGIPASMLCAFYVYHARRIKPGLQVYLICSVWAGYCASPAGFLWRVLLLLRLMLFLLVSLSPIRAHTQLLVLGAILGGSLAVQTWLRPRPTLMLCHLETIQDIVVLLIVLLGYHASTESELVGPGGTVAHTYIILFMYSTFLLLICFVSLRHHFPQYLGTRVSTYYCEHPILSFAFASSLLPLGFVLDIPPFIRSWTRTSCAFLTIWVPMGLLLRNRRAAPRGGPRRLSVLRATQCLKGCARRQALLKERWPFSQVSRWLGRSNHPRRRPQEG